MTPTSTRPAALRRALLEFLVIVVGVLTALAVDEWRTISLEQRREGEILSDLLAEFEENGSILASDLEGNRRRLATGQAWVGLADTDSPPPLDSAVLLSRDLTGFLIYQPLSGVLQSIVDAGELRLIRNRSLRARIAGWPGLAAEWTESQRLTSELMRSVLFPLEVRRPRVTEPSTILASLQDEALTNAHARINRQMLFSVQRGEALSDHLGEIIQSLREELESR